MRGTFERDDLYPWSVQAIGDKYVPQNLHTGEKLAGRDTYSEAEGSLRTHLDLVRRGESNRAAAITTS